MLLFRHKSNYGYTITDTDDNRTDVYTPDTIKEVLGLGIDIGGLYMDGYGNLCEEVFVKWCRGKYIEFTNFKGIVYLGEKTLYLYSNGNCCLIEGVSTYTIDNCSDTEIRLVLYMVSNLVRRVNIHKGKIVVNDEEGMFMRRTRGISVSEFQRICIM